MLTKSALAAGAIVALAAMQPTAATAGTDVHLGFGFGLGLSGPGHVPHPYYPAYAPASRLSCGEARAIVRDHGYHVLRARDCRGSVYSFVAKRGWRTYLVSVSSRTGRIVDVRRV